MTFVLDATTRALKITIDAGAGADVQFVATYADSTSTTFTKGSSQGASNGSTAVDVVSAPAASTRRVVKAISFYNANATDPRTITFYYDDNGTAYTIAKFTLQAGQSWYSETASTEEKGATILDATNRTIQFSIDTAGSDVQYTAAWADSTDTAFTQGSSRGLSNGTSAVTIVGAPAASTRRLVQSITFYNAHASATRVVTLFYDNNGTTRTIAKFSLVAGDSWFSEVATFGIQPQGYVYAAPSAGSGLPSFRGLAISDVFSGSTGSGNVVLQTSPTIITPRIAAIHTASNPFRAVVSFVQATNSANYLQITNAASGLVGSYYQGPILEAVGTGSDVDLKLKSKGLGNVSVTTSGLTVEPINSALSGIITVMGGTGTGAGGQLVIKTNGNNEIGFRTPDSLAASVYYVLPAADGTSGQLLSTNGSGVLSFRSLVVSDIPSLTSIYQPLDADLTAIAALSGDGLLRKSSGTWAMDSASYLTGNQTITLSGDVTGSGTTAITTTIANNAVTTAKILNSNVTLAKIADVAAYTLLGRDAATLGPLAAIATTTHIIEWLKDPTSAKLAAAVTDETGSGALVFATSPTLVTPTLGAASATSIAFNAGSASAPSITLTGDTNTGIFSPAADKLSVTTNGTVIGTFLGAAEGTGTGNLLVGDFTTHPVSAASGRGLTIMQGGLSELQFISYSSTCVIRSWVPNGTISAPTATTSSRSAVFGINGHTGTSYLLTASAAVLLQSTENFTSSAHGTSISLETTENGTTSRLSRVFIANDGKVGIATSSPTARLDIDSDKIRLRTSKTITYGQTAGGNNIDAGDVGDICWDANYIYVRVSASNWRRVATSTW